MTHGRDRRAILERSSGQRPHRSGGPPGGPAGDGESLQDAQRRARRLLDAQRNRRRVTGKEEQGSLSQLAVAHIWFESPMASAVPPRACLGT